MSGKLDDLLPVMKEAMLVASLYTEAEKQVTAFNCYHGGDVSLHNIVQLGVNVGCDTTEIKYDKPGHIIGVDYYKGDKLYLSYPREEKDGR